MIYNVIVTSPRLRFLSRLWGRFLRERFEFWLLPLRLSDSRSWNGKVSGSWSTRTIWSLRKWPTGSVPSDWLSSFFKAEFIFCSMTERPPRSLPIVDFQIDLPLNTKNFIPSKSRGFFFISCGIFGRKSGIPGLRLRDLWGEKISHHKSTSADRS